MGDGPTATSRGQSSQARTLLRFGVIFALLASAVVAVFHAQGAAQRTLTERAGPYLDAIVAGDHDGAASLDHPSRAFDGAALKAAYSGRVATLGRPTGWSTVVANSGRDGDGTLIIGKVHLTHDGRYAPVTLRVELREDGEVMKLAVLVPTSRSLDESVW